MALAILGILSVAFLSGLATSTRATIIADEHSTADSLAISQMEYVKNTGYVYETTGYTAEQIPDEADYADYSAVVTAAALNSPDDGIQKITVTIKRSGVDVAQVEGYKVDR